MAPRPLTSEAALPRTFRCKVCGQHKAASAYSKTQIQKWHKKKKKDRYNEVNPETVGLTCMDHIGEERKVRCHGPCDRLKPVEEFSKAQRNDSAPWCTYCTEWRTNLEGDQISTAAPSDPIATNPLPFWRDYRHEDEDEDEDAAGDPSYDPTTSTTAVSGLHGYDDAGQDASQDESTVVDAVSTVNTTGISLSIGENVDAGRGDAAGSDHSSGTVIGMQSNAARSGQTLVTRDGAYEVSVASQSHGSAISNTAASIRSGLPRHLHSLNQLTPVRDADGNLSSLVPRSACSRESVQLSEAVKKKVAAISNEPTKSNNDASKDNKNHKFYHPESRKVFGEGGKTSAAEGQDRAEASHDSDSSDEI